MKTIVQKNTDGKIKILEKYFVDWKHAANWCRWASRERKCKYTVVSFDGVAKQPTVEK